MKAALLGCLLVTVAARADTCSEYNEWLRAIGLAGVLHLEQVETLPPAWGLHPSIEPESLLIGTLSLARNAALDPHAQWEALRVQNGALFETRLFRHLAEELQLPLYRVVIRVLSPPCWEVQLGYGLVEVGRRERVACGSDAIVSAPFEKRDDLYAAATHVGYAPVPRTHLAVSEAYLRQRFARGRIRVTRPGSAVLLMTIDHIKNEILASGDRWEKLEVTLATTGDLAPLLLSIDAGYAPGLGKVPPTKYYDMQASFTQDLDGYTGALLTQLERLIRSQE